MVAVEEGGARPRSPLGGDDSGGGRGRSTAGLKAVTTSVTAVLIIRFNFSNAFICSTY